jgi:hypothetical protein
MANELQFFDAAKAALEKARKVDEVRKIHNTAAAIKAAATVADDRGLEANAHEIRLRAERRLGQLVDQQRKTVGLSKGGGGSKKRVSEKPSARKPTLAEVGIDKNLAHRSRIAARLTDREFERKVTDEKQQIESPDRFEKLGGLHEIRTTPAEIAKLRAVPPRYATVEDAAADVKRMRRLPDATEQCVAKVRDVIESTAAQMRRGGAGEQKIRFLFQRLSDELRAIENKTLRDRDWRPGERS